MDNRTASAQTGTPPPSGGTAAGSERLKSAMDEARRSADTVAADVKEAASDLAGQARAMAGEAAERTTHKVRDYAEQQKGVAADTIGRVSQATHAAADQLNEASPTVARYAHELAGGIDRFAGMVRERSVNDIVRSASDFARREPAMFVAGTVFVGFMMARFLRSSAERAEREERSRSGYTGSGQDRFGQDRFGQGGYRQGGERGGFGADRYRTSTMGPGSMPGQTGPGRSHDPTGRHDERDRPFGRPPGAGTGASPAGASGGVAGAGAGRGGAAPGMSSPGMASPGSSSSRSPTGTSSPGLGGSGGQDHPDTVPGMPRPGASPGGNHG